MDNFIKYGKCQKVTNFAPAYGSKEDILSSDNMLNKGYNTVWSELCECIRANSLQTV